MTTEKVDYSAIAAEMPTEPAAQKPPAADAEQQPPPTGEGEKAEPSEKPVEESKEPEKKDGATEKSEDPFAKGFEKLVRQQKQLREEREAAKHGFELAQAVSPAQATALRKALSSGDALAAMTALGFSYADVAKGVVGASKGEQKPPAEKAKEPEAPQGVALPPEVKEAVNYYRAARERENSQRIQAAVKEVVTSNPKFKHLSGLEAYDEVTNVVEEMFRLGGGLPSEDPMETLRMAAEEAEARLARQAERWRKVLTPGTQGATLPPKAPETPAGSTTAQSSGKTLNNKLGGVPSSTTALDHDRLIAEIAKSL